MPIQFVTASNPTDRPNYRTVTISNDALLDLTLAYSYDTLIAFQCSGYENARVFMVRNVWGPTTGQHMAHFSPSTRPDDRVGDAYFLDHLDAAYGVISQ